MAGFGGIIEGPLPNSKGSWLFSAQKSYLDLIVDAIGTGVAPRYGDIQGKATYDINSQNKLTFLNIYANNRINSDRDESIDSGDPYIFFSVVEISTTIFIIWTAWRWALVDSPINE